MIYATSPRDVDRRDYEALVDVLRAKHRFEDIASPLEFEDIPPEFDPQRLARVNIMRLTKASIIALFPGWMSDLTCRRELQVAVWCGLGLEEVYDGKVARLSVTRAKYILDQGLKAELFAREGRQGAVG